MLFFIYIFAVFYVVFYKYRFEFNGIDFQMPLDFYWENSVNLIPFKTIKDYIIYRNNLSDNIKYGNILGNIILFIPFGSIVPTLLKGRFRALKTFLYSFCFSLFIEIIQLFFRIGSFDVDDIILNTFGGLIGCLCYLIVRKIVIKRNRRIR